jgi:hypothetical protein
MTALNLVFDILVPICSVARTSDNLSLSSTYCNIILIALHYSLPRPYQGCSALRQIFNRRPTDIPLG